MEGFSLIDEKGQMRTCFTRGTDVLEYVNILQTIIDLMGNTIKTACNELDIDISKEMIIQSYCRLADGPTAVERVLINKGMLSEEECKANIFEERFLKKIKDLSMI